MFYVKKERPWDVDRLGRDWVPYLSYPNQLQSSTFTLVISQTDFLPGLILACLVWFGVAVVQWVGHRSFNREVPCSIPGGLR